MSEEFKEQPDFELFRLTVQKDLEGENGDEKQEEMLVSIFEGHLKHKMGTMRLWAGGNVGVLGTTDIKVWT